MRVRKSEPALGDGDLRWLDSEAGVLAFERDPGFACVVNLTDHAVDLPEGTPLLASAELDDPAAGEAKLPPDAAVWLRAGLTASGL